MSNYHIMIPQMSIRADHMNAMQRGGLFPTADSRHSRRARTDCTEVAYPLRVQRRKLERAPFLEGLSDGTLQRMANVKLERMHIDCDFGNSRMEGNRVYYDCGPNGKKCMHGRHHDHNRFYVEFQRFGEGDDSHPSAMLQASVVIPVRHHREALAYHKLL
ncbi:hypothetical protein WJX77_012395 [Trebouxia sp. C0004]